MAATSQVWAPLIKRAAIATFTKQTPAITTCWQFYQPQTQLYLRVTILHHFDMEEGDTTTGQTAEAGVVPEIQTEPQQDR